MTGPVPICLELALPSGFVDNLMITPAGGLVVVETKLWRNPQARREVVGQILDYAKDLSRLSYDDLERAAQIARKDKASLFSLVHGDAAPEAEATFIDAVSRNLRLGRMLLIIAGDGIQESAEQLTDFLQRHLGLHFTLAMVEMTLWRDPIGDRVLVQPRVLTKTVQIERAVVRIEQGMSVTPAWVEPLATTTGAARTSSLTSEAYYEALAASNPSLPGRLKALLEALESLGVQADIRRVLMLRWFAPTGAEFKLGAIDQDGRFSSDYANWSADVVGRVDLAHAYQSALAALLPGAQVKQTPSPTGWRVVDAAGRNPELAVLLDHREDWIGAITAYIEALQSAVEARG
ncbi:hypothetical protein [Brevundimonas sp. Leaf363]|uniref:hypothetical protein n=1 Tax=Brevundimonas sp. Leaf363 TaxID=1736353 RepID=UPI0012E1461C|nr:hypothetical protein [Brevundimonas sp. Leaf363]